MGLTTNSAPVSRAEAFRIWLKIGCLSFGGPAGQIALMHRELVERRRWISESRFLHALNYCMLIPGPEAQQLATYIGWLMHRTWGGLVAGALFVLPGFLVMLLLSWIYARFHQVPAIAAVFFGLKAAILAVVVEALLRVSTRALSSPVHWYIAALAFIAIFFFAVPFPVIMVAAGLTGLLAKRLLPIATSRDPHIDEEGGYLIDQMHSEGRLAHAAPSAKRAAKVLVLSVMLWVTPLLLVYTTVGPQHVLWHEGVFFSQTALVTFGGAYSVLAYVAQRAVEQLHWLNPGEMIDGLALAETTPGPLILVLQYVGFLAAYRLPETLLPWLSGFFGAVVTVWVTFVPCFLFIFLGGPYIETLRQNVRLRAALSCVTAAVVGVILNLSVWFAANTLFREMRAVAFGAIEFDVPRWSSLNVSALILSAIAFVAMFRLKLGMGWTLLSCAALGFVISHVWR
jgi:chromate transporter